MVKLHVELVKRPDPLIEIPQHWPRMPALRLDMIENKKRVRPELLSDSSDENKSKKVKSTKNDTMIIRKKRIPPPVNIEFEKFPRSSHDDKPAYKSPAMSNVGSIQDLHEKISPQSHKSPFNDSLMSDSPAPSQSRGSPLQEKAHLLKSPLFRKPFPRDRLPKTTYESEDSLDNYRKSPRYDSDDYHRHREHRRKDYDSDDYHRHREHRRKDYDSDDYHRHREHRRKDYDSDDYDRHREHRRKDYNSDDNDRHREHRRKDYNSDDYDRHREHRKKDYDSDDYDRHREHRRKDYDSDYDNRDRDYSKHKEPESDRGKIIDKYGDEVIIDDSPSRIPDRDTPERQVSPRNVDDDPNNPYHKKPLIGGSSGSSGGVVQDSIASVGGLKTKNISEEEQNNMKKTYLEKYHILQMTYNEEKFPQLTNFMDLDLIINTYETEFKRVTLQANLNEYKMYLVLMFCAFEYGLKFLFDVDTYGFVKQQLKFSHKYDKLLIQLGEREYMSFGDNWPAEVKIVVMFGFHIMVFFASKQIGKKFGQHATDTIQDVLGNVGGVTQQGNVSMNPLTGVFNMFMGGNIKPNHAAGAAGGGATEERKQMKKPTVDLEDL